MVVLEDIAVETVPRKLVAVPTGTSVYGKDGDGVDIDDSPEEVTSVLGPLR